MRLLIKVFRRTYKKKVQRRVLKDILQTGKDREWEKQQSKERTEKLVNLVSTIFVVAGFGILSIPLYRALCQSLGWDGTVDRENVKAVKKMKLYQQEREKKDSSGNFQPPEPLSVRFHSSSNSPTLKFTPCQEKIWSFFPKKLTLKF
ncbi:hypothetical protein MHBO_004751 [Bonamia ostreae]|uniref:Uncharacterized protein n=1 Tax=Bonamia ostreae TaxID=126728 RepID=A0ABV2AU50_9EUKA